MTKTKIKFEILQPLHFQPTWIKIKIRLKTGGSRIACFTTKLLSRNYNPRYKKKSHRLPQKKNLKISQKIVRQNKEIKKNYYILLKLMSNIYLYKKQCNDEMYTKLQHHCEWKKKVEKKSKSKHENRKIETKNWLIEKSKKKSKFRRGLLSDCLLNCYLFKSTLYELINYVLSCNLTTFILKKSFCGIIFHPPLFSAL